MVLHRTRCAGSGLAPGSQINSRLLENAGTSIRPASSRVSRLGLSALEINTSEFLPVLSFTTKQAPISSADQGGGERALTLGAGFRLVFHFVAAVAQLPSVQ
jgi:hypothetical protein